MPMTRQQIFDRAATHLLIEQRKPAMHQGKCAYHTPNGLSCAIGCLIPDEAYHPHIGGAKAANSRVLGQLVNTGVLPPSPSETLVSFLLALQSLAHDRGATLFDNNFLAHCREDLHKVAADFGLNTECLER